MWEAADKLPALVFGDFWQLPGLSRLTNHLPDMSLQVGIGAMVSTPRIDNVLSTWAAVDGLIAFTEQKEDGVGVLQRFAAELCVAPVWVCLNIGNFQTT